MSTTAFEESLHPREQSGKFATKPTADAAGGMDALEAATPTLQTDRPLERASLSAAHFTALNFVGIRDSGLLELEPPYQRASVWTTDQQRNLVRSWCMGLPVPAVIINNRLMSNWEKVNGEEDFRTAVVDGKQRIETALAWFDSELTVPASWFPAPDVLATEATSDGPYVRFENLSRSAQRRMGNHFALPTAEARVDTMAAEAEIFSLVNGCGTAQTEADLARARAVAANT